MTDALLDPSAVRDLLARLDLRPSKQRGQNFVVDANTVRRIVARAELAPDDVVLEVGPGLGSLTLALLDAGHAVTAIEIEDVMAEQLPRTVVARLPEASDRLQVVHADALKVTDLPDPQPTALVANLPYNVAVPVVLHLFEHVDFARGLVMVQEEVADRMTAGPGSRVYGVPSVKLAWYARARFAGRVPPTVFHPVPRVDSGLVALTRRPAPETSASRRQVFAVIDAAFAQRRKMLRSALSGLFGSSAAASAALAAAKVDPQSRGEQLTIADFARIAEHLPPSTDPAGEPARANL